jgi:predicted protein tyrosine phosphatase
VQVLRFFAQMSQITARLYLGALNDALDRTWLDSKRITHVLSIIDLPEIDILHEMLAAAGIEHRVVPALDTAHQDLTPQFQSCFDFIDAGEIVLVHCHFGISRSATVVLAYLMHSQRLHLDEALAQVLAARPEIFPNDAFIRQLIAYEKSARGTMSFLPTIDGIRKFKRAVHDGPPKNNSYVHVPIQENSSSPNMEQIGAPIRNYSWQGLYTPHKFKPLLLNHRSRAAEQIAGMTFDDACAFLDDNYTTSTGRNVYVRCTSIDGRGLRIDNDERDERCNVKLVAGKIVDVKWY